jgi:hypothetical protein
MGQLVLLLTDRKELLLLASVGRHVLPTVDERWSCPFTC